MPEQAADVAFFVILAECVGFGMLGPLVLRAVARLLRPYAGGGLLRLALDDITTMTRALSGALVPLVLATAFAIVKIATHTTAAHVSGIADPPVDRWTDYSGTAVYCAFAGVAAFNCFVTVLPTGASEAIAGHACTRRSGRVGTSAAGRALHPEAVRAAVVASVRHVDTSYDELLMAGVPRAEARERVENDVHDLLAVWRSPPPG